MKRMPILKERLIQEPLENPIGSSTLYSDLGFMFLRWVVEQVSGMKMHRLVEKEIYAPLGIKDLFFPVAQEPAVKQVCGNRNVPLAQQADSRGGP